MIEPSSAEPQSISEELTLPAEGEPRPLTGLVEIASYLGFSPPQIVLRLISGMALPALYVPQIKTWITNTTVVDRWLIAASKQRIKRGFDDVAVRKLRQARLANEMLEGIFRRNSPSHVQPNPATPNPESEQP